MTTRETAQADVERLMEAAHKAADEANALIMANPVAALAFSFNPSEETYMAYVENLGAVEEAQERQLEADKATYEAQRKLAALMFAETATVH